ncbi:GTPase-activating protein [Serendipita sp. 396]|nr:GTPase-activating protein [Serendipita sp. 396]KAG8787312.1 GTPase-activating protein [Serendipita sp. 397]KAG8802443.1 GTPase-activating protein [Serendipita sp. 398]KAG8825941.1 GTPase-activating protein [Serendipita sp. 401]KAG8838121.1 GTPase-activating protein [Serendipita sp. 400]KAG8858900.1 GTPase-activating protein [Serendipita sp. 411]KAG8872014.1 GTPase-activating protein [Serendipita sp. 405]KAG9056720.1 GTPase-activating protein [Serendipita sp. 407]
MSTTTTMAEPTKPTPTSETQVVHLTTPDRPKEPKSPAKENKPSPVDDLLSPVTADEPTPTAVTNREEPHETQDIVEDESRFSNVSLSATPHEPLSSGLIATTFSSPRRSSVSSTTNMEISLVTPRTSMSATLASTRSTKEKANMTAVPHVETLASEASLDPKNTAVLSPTSPADPMSAASEPNTHADFILAKLEKEALSPTRASMDGKNLLQAEFDQVRRSQEGDDTESVTGDGINWEFWGGVMSDYESFARNEPKTLAKAIEAGIPPSLRGMLWQLMSASKDVELEAIYANLIKGQSPHEKSITRDLGRTFPHHAFFNDGQGVGQESLFNVLKAYSLYDPECGYCQGLPFIVAPLLLVCPDEEAFCLLVRLMQSYELRGHFLPEMPGLQLRLFQFGRLIEDMLPVLHIHFLRQGVKLSMFCSQWFMTLFAYRFPLELVFRIFDHVLATGVDAVFSFSVLLLQKNEVALLSMGFDQILEFLKSNILDCYKEERELRDGEEEHLRIDDFIRDATALRITPFQLDGYAGEYIEMRRAQTAHLMEMDSLRNENRMLKARIKKLEESYAQVETEHCDVINQLVRAKVEKEEYEAELVRFKLLYAELMHQHEDARSSNRLSSISQLSGNQRQLSA